MNRRTFTKRTLAAAAATLLPAPARADEPRKAKSAASSSAEAEARYQLILAKRGSRLSAAQKDEVHRMVLAQQKALDQLRAFPLDNSDQPALILRPRRK